MNKVALIGIDTAKQVFRLTGVDAGGRYVWRRKVSRSCKGSPVGEPTLVDRRADKAKRRVPTMRVIHVVDVAPMVPSHDLLPVPTNLSVPVYRFIQDDVIMIGAETGAA